jgi:hypothetical protein
VGAPGGTVAVAAPRVETTSEATSEGVRPWPVIATLAALVIIDLPSLGTDGWDFRPALVEPRGLFAPLVRLAGGEWDLGTLRAPALIAGLVVALLALGAWRAPLWRPRRAVALVALVVALLLAPAVFLQTGLRQATEPWFFTNDSTYQIELAGDLVAKGDSPYGHEYADSGLARFYTLDGEVTKNDHAALHHFAYFPGTPLSAAGWRFLPSSLRDYRLFVLLATFGFVFVSLLFEGPIGGRLALGAVLSANPLALQSAWFGLADAPSLLFLVLSFALVTRSRYASAAASLAVAILLRQFALVAVPFFVGMLVVRGVRRATLRGAGLVFASILAAGFLPFLLADPRALWDDTVGYGTGVYAISGYGLAPLLIRAGVLRGAGAAYPFALLAIVAWLPLTAWLLWNQVRARALWVGPAGFAVAIFVLLFIARVFHSSYLVWPLTGAAVAALLATSELPGGLTRRSP